MMEKPLFALTLAAGMESDAESILQKKHTEGLNRMKEANKYADWLLAQDPDATDAFIALGIANYVIGLPSACVRSSRFGSMEFTATGSSGWSRSPKLRSTNTSCAPSQKSSLPLPPATKNRLSSQKSCYGNCASSIRVTVCLRSMPRYRARRCEGLGLLTSVLVGTILAEHAVAIKYRD